MIAVAHGSRDPRSAATVSAVVGRLSASCPQLDVRLAFLDLSTPSVEQVVDAVAAQGHTEAVVVPLLLGSAYHARVDLPGLLAQAGAQHPRMRLVQADVLGPDARLVTALRDRVLETGADPRDGSLGIAVAAVGSSSPEANHRTRIIARMLAAGTAWRTSVCFATVEPSLPQTISHLRSRGSDQVMVAPWFLAPGLLTDRLRATIPDVPHTCPIGNHPQVAEVILTRYLAALPHLARRAAA
ncbi:sirohydrochlorin chelatase [Nocardia sp. CDC159]|uniref:Sirohydrochlorin chelatase n=1 Tax=Nocardia pulmonis TaxID=2951408 RepID=A0A9X2E4V6_9NOCA|nr:MULTISPECIES: sirohydrochlorin chelatase [Nocardia]MCM6773661.1 sirohydrochlorin chelatase [Nocardia pulmonis]MCM6786548.1 sirohydrochlorin chelatase [Nocardia sp. CDC159]